MGIDTMPLKGKIRERFGSQEKFAEEIGLSLTSVSDVLNGKRGLSRDQIVIWAKALAIELDSPELNRVFFSSKS